MKKYLFFDVDGTLYNSKKELPEKTKKAIQLARTNGHEIAIATGRAPFMIESLLNELEINTYVSFNGQYVVLNGEVIQSGASQMLQVPMFINQQTGRYDYNQLQTFLSEYKQLTDAGQQLRNLF